jgi:general secretion pathway protein G
LYLSPGLHGDMDVYTLGADGLQGGSGMNADIGNWNAEQ